MTRLSMLRGNRIYWDGTEFRYCDNDEPTLFAYRDRPCGICHQMSTPEGHDACLGELPGVVNACCGHGDNRSAYVQLADGQEIRGPDALIAATRLQAEVMA